MKVKDKIVNLFFEEEHICKSTVGERHLKRKYILSMSCILNFILNLFYLSFICYRFNSNRIGFIWFIISVIWTVVSVMSSYGYADYKGNNVFYLNIILALLMSKMWFVYF